MGSASVLRKLLLSSMLLILVALGSAAIFLSRYTAESEQRHADSMMSAQLRILAPELAGTELPDLKGWTTRAAAQSRARVTVIAMDGVVLADSQGDPASMENHGGRPEVRQALKGGSGSNVRRSATIDVDLFYRAVLADLRGRGGVVLRLAVPLRQVDSAKGEVRWLIVRSSLIAAGFALLVAFFFSRSFTRRIRRIQHFARDLVNEEYSSTLAVESDDELGSVALSLRGMAEQFRRMLEGQKAESARRRALLAGMVEGVLAVDHSLRVTFCNSSFARSINQRDLPENLRVVEVLRDPEFLELLRQVIASGEPARRRLTLSAAKGRIFEVQGSPIGERPGMGAVAVLHDVTDLEHLERVRKDFVANISHELRTPLASIRGYAETLLDGAAADRETQRRFLEIIWRNTVRLGDLASDLLTLSELETEPHPPPAVAVSIRAVVATALRAVESEAVSRGVDVFSGVIEDVWVKGQRTRLEQALMNLLNNGIRFNQSGGEVRLEAISVDGQVRITVSDNGIGIPTQDQPRIFERFYRVDKAHSRDTGGTGLGLSIVKHIVEKMDGAVAVESRLGKGSVFTVTLPGTASDADPTR